MRNLSAILLAFGLASTAHAATPAISGGYDHVLVLRSDGTAWVTGTSGTSLAQVTDLTGLTGISAALYASLFLKTDGTVWGSGVNFQGVLGNGSASNLRQPLQQAVGLAQIRQLDCGHQHCLAVRSDGSVWAWGANDLGQVGDGTTADRHTAIRVEGPTNIVAVSAAGGFRSLALAADGTVWTWGTFADIRVMVPQKMSGLSGVKAIAGSVNANMFLKADGTVWSSATVQVGSISDIVAIAANGEHHLALKRDGSVWAWGVNRNGVIGSGDFTQGFYVVPSRVQGLGNVVAIGAGRQSAYALTADGSAYAWGANNIGQLGDNTITDRAAPVRMAGPGGVGSFDVLAAQSASNQLPSARMSVSADTGSAPLTVSAEATNTFDFDGSIVRYEWFVSDGRIASGPSATFVFSQPGSFTISLLVTDNSGGSRAQVRNIVVSSSLGAIHTKPMIVGGYTAAVAIRADGKAFSWGFNNQLGRPGKSPWQTTVVGPIDSIAGVTSIAMGQASGLASMADGSVAGWGYNNLGEIGDGTTNIRLSPVPVQGIGNVVAVAAGTNHSVALKSDGTVWAWGGNAYGELGTGTAVDSKTPVQVSALGSVTAIAAGANFTVALKSDGSVWAWGINQLGELGDSSGSSRSAPARINSLARISRIWCGRSHCFASDLDGVVWAWGANYIAQLGLGSTSPMPGPVAVPSLKSFIEFAMGAEYSIGLRADGSVWRWGQQRKPGTPADPAQTALVPVVVPGIRNAIGIGATAWGTGAYALNADGTVLSWGTNRSGEVGDGTLAARVSPVSMVNEALDGLFDLLPDVPNDPSLSKAAPFFSQAASTGSLTDPTLTVNNFTKFNSADVGTTGSVYVFALAPANVVKGAVVAKAQRFASVEKGEKDASVQCVLAQLTSTGQLQAVSASNLQAYVTGVLASQGQAVTVLNGVATANIGGATFYVGYGTSAGTMLSNGINRSVVSVPGAVECNPQPPQTGWWWNPAEGGRGYSIEAQGNRLFMAAFLYDASGRASWYVASGATSLDGSLFNGRLLSVKNGQTLAGAYRKPDTVTDEGAVTLAFNSASQGTMVWPGGTVAIERQNIVTNGLTSAPQANQPETGWWWNAAEDGRGFFIEWQAGYADLAGYMYDDAGNPVWYISVYPTPNATAFGGNWWQYANGQTLTGAYKPAAQINANVAPLTMQFTSPETATMTLPGGKQVALTRFRF